MQMPDSHSHSITSNRRRFLKTVTAFGAAISSVEMPNLARAQNLAGELTVGLIGAGIRGYELHEVFVSPSQALLFERHPRNPLRYSMLRDVFRCRFCAVRNLRLL